MTLLLPILSGEGVKGVLVSTKTQGPLPYNATVTLTSMSFGDEFGERRLVVATGAEYDSGTPLLSSVTVGGVSADIVANKNNGNGSSGISVAHVPTGTSGDVVIVSSGPVRRIYAAVYSVSGLYQNAVYDKVEDAGNGGDIDIPSGGLCIGVTFRNSGSISWSGLTEDNETDYGGIVTASVASASFPNAETGKTITSSGSSFPTTCIASWGS